MASRKKVLVRTLKNELHPGYLPLTGILSPEAPDALDLLDLSGHLLPLPLASVRFIAFVRDFNRNETQHPENLLRRTFLSRPRTEGLWLRLTFLDGDTLEGLAPLDLSLLDGVLNDRGLLITPPDIRSNTQRLFVPRSALASLQLLAVITSPSRPGSSQPSSPQSTLDLQLDLPHTS